MPFYDSFQSTVDIVLTSFPILFEAAILVSFPLAVLSFIIGILIAFIAVFMLLSNQWILKKIASFYISLFRGTPLLVQLFIIFYGMPSMGIILPSYQSALIGFSLNVGAYSAESLRGGIASIAKGQWEASYTFGFSRLQIMLLIIFPQALRSSVPALSNSFISLVKDTSLASTVLVSDMFRKAQQIAATNNEFLIIYIQAAFIYWLLCTLLSFFQQRLERYFNRYGLD